MIETWAHPLVPAFKPAPFVVPRWLRNGQIMTIFAALYPRNFRLPPSHRRAFETSADTTVIAKCHWQKNPQQHPTIVLIHGLEGNANRSYMMGTAQKAFDAGFNVLRMNVRNCGGTEHLTPTLYHSGWTHDLQALLTELLEKDGLKNLFLVGFSMGGNHALKLAGELGENFPSELKGIVAVSPPLDLAQASKKLGAPSNFIYNRRFLRSLKKRLHLKERLYSKTCDLEKLKRAKNIWQFDDAVTAPHFGFRDALDYYTQASAFPFLSKICVPSLIIQAQDDPFIPSNIFAQIAPQKFLAILSTKHGGHLGFWSNQKNSSEHYWAEQTAVDYCLSLCNA